MPTKKRLETLQFLPDWQATYTAAEFTLQFGLPFQGAGWYEQGEASLFATPLSCGQYTDYYRVYVWDTPKMWDILTGIAMAPVFEAK